MKKFLLKNSETGFQKAETRFQNAETRFQNTETALSRIFFARNGMDSAQKKPAQVVGHYLTFLGKPVFKALSKPLVLQFCIHCKLESGVKQKKSIVKKVEK